MALLKPLLPVIDWGNPITKNLVFDMPLWEKNASPHNIVNTVTGALTGSAITFGNSFIGSYIDFHGTATNFIDFTEASWNINTGSNITLEGWIIPSDTAGGEIFSKVHATSGHTSPFFSYSLQVNNLGFRIWITTSGSPGGIATTESIPPVAGKLYHAIGTYDGTNMRMYINGVLVNTKGATGTITNFSGTPLRITSNGGGSEVLNGHIFNSRMWNRTLNPIEVMSLYTNPWQLYIKYPMMRQLNNIFSHNSAAAVIASTFPQYLNLMGVGQ